MTKIVVKYGKRNSDMVALEISNLSDAVEIYNKAKEITGSDSIAADVLESVANGNFDIE